MILRLHIPGARPYEIGDEIWDEALADAIDAEAETIAGYAGSDLLESPDRGHRDDLRARIVAEMTLALVSAGDRYRAPDGVLYSLVDEPADDLLVDRDTLNRVSSQAPEPVVEEILQFEDLPIGSSGTRRVIVRWTDGTESVAATWYSDEILSPVDRVGRH